MNDFDEQSSIQSAQLLETSLFHSTSIKEHPIYKLLLKKYDIIFSPLNILSSSQTSIDLCAKI